ncbi:MULTISPECIES: hypothetical protein [Streptomyces]|jgi:hypothetical protein|uniref:Peptidase inhibitor family I36 n=2 Tax=Streptomyces bottropensis TaxID=42235 RepID=M3EXI3_9ACTN|nr:MULTISPECIES: hypothetical protein [Streptomyces]EMF53903.1 hypothetical protein SBD_5447 [Streptomyces bottropensis ATCC 25435]MZD17890.1 hypothetical protein [Streptomyces sp. SID5476]
MRKLKAMRTAAALVLAAGAVMTATATQAQAATSHGCPDGYVCIYPENAGWNNDQPSHKYYTYGYHNLSNMVGTHRIINNQTGGATMQTCTGYNGTGCEGYLPGGGWSIDKYMTPINSIRLNP